MHFEVHETTRAYTHTYRCERIFCVESCPLLQGTFLKTKHPQGDRAQTQGDPDWIFPEKRCCETKNNTFPALYVGSNPR
jgi:hypothetical protein